MKAADSMFVKKKIKVQVKEMLQKVKVKEKRVYKSITGLRNEEKQVKKGGLIFPAGHFSVPSLTG